jgi:hypothetical protein
MAAMLQENWLVLSGCVVGGFCTAEPTGELPMPGSGILAEPGIHASG